MDIKPFAFILLFAIVGCQKSSHPSGSPRQDDKPNPSAPGNLAHSAALKCQITTFGIEWFDGRSGLDKAISNHVWTTSLGTLFRKYIFETPDRSDLSTLAGSISNYILSQTDLIPPRVDAVRWMVDDLYICDLMDPQTSSKIQMLHLAIESERLNMEHHSALPTMLDVLPYFVGIGFLSGSNEFRTQLVGVSRKAYNYLLKRLGRPISTSSKASSASLMNLFGPKFFTRYSPGTAYMVFMHTAMAYMILHDFAMNNPSEKKPMKQFNMSAQLLNYEDL